MICGTPQGHRENDAAVPAGGRGRRGQAPWLLLPGPEEPAPGKRGAIL